LFQAVFSATEAAKLFTSHRASVLQQSSARAVIAPSAMVIELSLLYVSFYITFMLQGRSNNDLSHSSILAGNRFIHSLPSLRSFLALGEPSGRHSGLRAISQPRDPDDLLRLCRKR